MSSLHNLKQIVDILYEEHKQFEFKNGLTEIPRLKHHIQQLELQLQGKDKELADLYTKNAELENTIRRYEYDFELLANLGVPQENQKENQQKQENTAEISKENQKQENTTEIPQEIPKETPKEEKKPKKDRREYMKAYHREYRRKRREEKAINMTV